MPPIHSDVSPQPAVPARRLSPLLLKLVAFCFAGAVGFFVDSLATLTMINFGLGYFLARAAGISVAIFATYVLNRGLAFRKEASIGAIAVASEFARYVAVALPTSALNLGIYAAALAVIPGLPPIIAIVIGSAAAMVASYLGFARLVFRG